MSMHYPSLFLIMNGYDARWFRVEKESIEEIETLRDTKAIYTDHEVLSAVRGGNKPMSGGAPDVENKITEEEVRQHVHHVVSRTKELLRDREFVDVSVALPKQYKHLIEDAFEKSLSEQTIRYIYGNHTHRNKEDVKQLFVEHVKLF